MQDEQHYSLLDAVPLGVFVIDAKYKVLFWNTTLEEWTSKSRQQVVGLNLGTLYPHLLEGRYTSRLHGIFQGGPPTIFSSQLHRYIIPVALDSGKFRVQHTTVTAVATEQTEQPYHAMFSIQDVTDLTQRIQDYREMRDEAVNEIRIRKETESALKVSESRYRALSELITDFAFSLNRQEDGTYVREWVTDAFSFVTGYQHDEFTNLADWTQMIYPDDLPSVERMFRTLLAAWADDQLEHRILTKDGKVRYVQTHLRPVVDDTTHRVTKIYGAVQDITRRKLAEHRLRASELRFRQIAENIDIVIYIYDRAKHEVVYTNTAYERVTGQTRRRIYSNPQAFTAIIHPDDQEDVEAAYRTRNANNERMDISFRILRPQNQEMRWIRERTFPIDNGDGDTNPRHIGLLEDITAQKEASEREFAFALEREQVQLLANFISDATHEFRTPLSVINSSIYLLNKMQDEARREHYTTLIQEQVSAISELVDVLVLMIGLDRQPEGESEQVDINNVFKMIVDQFVVRLRESRHITTTHFYGAPLHVYGHPSHLWQALVAIVDNAIRYTPEAGRITLRSARVDNYAVLEVEDTGDGIKDEDLPRIFDRFYRVDTAHSTRGFGLGLPIAKKVIERHHGQIEVNTRVGQGSLFRVRLPLAENGKPTSTSEMENHFSSTE